MKNDANLIMKGLFQLYRYLPYTARRIITALLEPASFVAIQEYCPIDVFVTLWILRTVPWIVTPTSVYEKQHF